MALHAGLIYRAKRALPNSASSLFVMPACPFTNHSSFFFLSLSAFIVLQGESVQEHVEIGWVYRW